MASKIRLATGAMLASLLLSTTGCYNAVVTQSINPTTPTEEQKKTDEILSQSGPVVPQPSATPPAGPAPAAQPTADDTTNVMHVTNAIEEMERIRKEMAERKVTDLIESTVSTSVIQDGTFGRSGGGN